MGSCCPKTTDKRRRHYLVCPVLLVVFVVVRNSNGKLKRSRGVNQWGGTKTTMHKPSGTPETGNTQKDRTETKTETAVWIRDVIEKDTGV